MAGAVMSKYDDLRRMREQQVEENRRDAAIARRRLREINSGKVKLLSVDEVKAATSRRPRRHK
jgi:hypothetical protein